MQKNAYFISDLHLGAWYHKANPHRDLYFEQFIQSLTGKASHLFILGDLFEFWMEYGHFVPKGHFRVLAALRTLKQSGTEVHYLIGNHDFDAGDFFRHQVGIEIHRDEIRLELQGKRVLLLHGDGMGSGDWGYRILKHFIRSPWAARLYRLLHPEIGMAIALGTAKFSRSRHGNIPRHLPRYEAAAIQLLRTGQDIVMHGHVHAGFVKHFPEGVYINTGEWFERLQFVEMAEGQCMLKTYEPSNSLRISSSLT